MDIKSYYLIPISLSYLIKYFVITILFLWMNLIPADIHAQHSTCYGTTRQGRIERAVKLPVQGKNFSPYSMLAVNLGRTYLHSRVRDVIVAAYQQLAVSLPDTIFVYGETGFEKGGKFAPHKTHQNGLSIDFMVPVRDQHNRSVKLPTNPLNKYGYEIEFDQSGRYNNLRIDFEALAAHLVALHQQAEQHHIGIWRVLFDPALQPHLLDTRHGGYIKRHIKLANKRSWVRHDEHYHVDFALPCEELPS